MAFKSTVTSDSPSPTERGKWLGGRDLIRHITDYKAWRETNSRNRHKLLNSILPANEWRGEALPADLEEIRRDRGINSALTAITERRRGAARMLKDFKQPDEPSNFIEHDGETIDLAQHQMGAVVDEIARLNKEVTRLTRASMRSVVLTEEGEERVKKLQEKAGKIPHYEEHQERALEARKPLNLAASDAAERLSTTKTEYDRARLRVQTANAATQIGAKCGTCYQEISEEYRGKIERAAAAAQSQLEEAHEAHKQAQADYDEANASAVRARTDERDAGVLLRDARQAEKELNDYKEQIEKAKEDGLDYSKIDADLQSASRAKRRAKAIEAGLNDLDFKHQAFDDSMKQIGRMKANLDVMQKIEQCIESNIQSGSRDVMQIAARHVGSLGKYFGREIQLGDDFLPMMDRIPFQLLCESDQYLSLVAVQYALAVVSGMNFMFIDSLDRLTKDRLVTLRRWMQEEAVGAGVQIVAAVAREKPVALQKSPFHIVAIEPEPAA